MTPHHPTPNKTMEGKVIAITGGASGIGLATAKLISSRGATICIADISDKDLECAHDHFTVLEVPFMTTKVDVSKRENVHNWVESIILTFGQLDGAANCAGIVGKHHGITKITEVEDEEWDRIIAINLTGTMYCLRAELREISDGGSIVNITSIQGVMGFPGAGAYSTSKHGVIGLTRCAAKEVGERGIRVNAVAPGAILTPLLRKAWEGNPDEAKNNPAALNRLGTAEEMAQIIAFLLGPESSYVTGSVYGGDGGWNC